MKNQQQNNQKKFLCRLSFLTFTLPSLCIRSDIYSGEAAPGCSAHDDGCDGSTGTKDVAKIIGKI
jgi:hypothetical protein